MDRNEDQAQSALSLLNLLTLTTVSAELHSLLGQLTTLLANSQLESLCSYALDQFSTVFPIVRTHAQCNMKVLSLAVNIW